MPRRKSREQEIGDEGEDTVHESSSSTSLYEVLGVERTASHEDIRKAYHKLALRLHPDKNPDDEDAKEKFQSLQNVMSILGDPAKRKVYDDTGSTEDAELSSETVQNLYQFFRALFKQITEDNIEEFAASYQGSESEKQDLKDLYIKCGGKMDRVFDQLMCSDPEQDSHRFMDIIKDAIAAGELKEYKAYKTWAKNIAKKPRPPEDKKSANRKNKSSSEGSEASLLGLIASKQKQRNAMDSLAAALEARYAGKAKSKRSKKMEFKEPSEEEFEAAQKRVAERQKARGKKG